ncbi:HNH endonuclease [Bradyrhizobium sp. AUGA SZCCT0240]|uniref:HNH endonuclease n=1 Tax=Bradyrhizobium sp. AUGA SZCCT0240 TaxID=2807669 RepID=UPI0020128DDD|nr:HNH endonuclease signature motif containing protein [Bradyrhizobium sp. AUGA SZCCT0240]
MNRVWSFLTIDGARQYGGNTGYNDDPEAVYRYDSDVANHLQVQVGDVVFVRSRSKVLGVGEIESVVVGAGQKDRLRCPHCKVTNIKQRLTRSPRWACKSGHHFDEPLNEPVAVSTYEARYASSFRSVPPELTVSRLNEAVLRPSDQMSIKEMDLARLEPLLGRDADALLRRYVSRMPVPGELTVARDDSLQSVIAERRRVLREISLRRGQKQFRDRLIRRYGVRCQISGYDFTAALEAAHIRPYASSEDNGAGNGLLLRSDLHTLFDLGFVGIDPDTLRISFNPACMCTGYREFDGILLFVGGTTGPDPSALAQHWEFFHSCLSNPP